MRILMIAPEPCFQPRGTPFSVYHRIVALVRLGHEVDLATYPIGDDAELDGLRIYRSLGVPFISNVKVGPSWAKFLLDPLLFLRCVGLLLANRYDAIHTHEEAGLFGVILSRIARKPHVYDMHSDLGQQLANFQFTRSRFLIALMDAVQKLIARGSDTIIVICRDLQRRAEELAPGHRVVLIENTSMLGSFRQPSSTEIEGLRHDLNLEGRRVLLYTGTMETYQGLEPLLHSVPRVVARHPATSYLIVGGQPGQVSILQGLADRLGIRDHVIFEGTRPPEEMWAYMALADILVSPRMKGTNTPLKLYAYLRSGRPILATDLITHTQVLSPETAMLVEPSADGLAEGALQLLEEPTLARRLAQQSVRLAETRYTYQAFLRKTASVYAAPDARRA